MACGTEKGAAGTTLVGLIGNIGFTIYKGRAALSLASPFAVIGAILRFLAAIENMETCLELQNIDVTKLREQRLRLQQEVDELNRQLQQKQHSQP